MNSQLISSFFRWFFFVVVSPRRKKREQNCNVKLSSMLDCKARWQKLPDRPDRPVRTRAQKASKFTLAADLITDRPAGNITLRWIKNEIQFFPFSYNRQHTTTTVSATATRSIDRISPISLIRSSILARRKQQRARDSSEVERQRGQPVPH